MVYTVRNKIKVLSVLGTRPEIIKLAPVIHAIQQNKDFESIVVATAQHREMLDQTLAVFGIKPQIDLDLMEEDQKLTNLSSKILRFVQEIFDREKPHLLICQGDTTSAFVCGLTAYYNKIPIAHIEAGLRTFNHNAPFPEEGNRQLLSVIASLNFCPTEKAKKNLLSEFVDKEKIFVTGNTVIDSLLWITSEDYNFKNKILQDLDFSSERIILVTAHRRESFGKPMENIFKAIQSIARNYHDVKFVFPVHLNPNVRKKVKSILGNEDRVHLLEPLDYKEFVHLMQKSFLILSDSGGVQEEAPSFGVPVLVLRKVTERTEAVEAGAALLIGTEKDDIVKNIEQFLEYPSHRKKFCDVENPFGDGRASQRILETINKFFGLK